MPYEPPVIYPESYLLNTVYKGDQEAYRKGWADKRGDAMRFKEFRYKGMYFVQWRYRPFFGWDYEYEWQIVRPNDDGYYTFSRDLTTWERLVLKFYIVTGKI